MTDLKKIQQIFEKFYLTTDIAFDTRYHRYTINGETFAGISSVAGYRPKEHLVAWAAKMVVENLQNKLDDIKKLDQKSWLKLLQEAKKTHKKKSQEAADIGKSVHLFVENYIKDSKTEMPKDKTAQNACNQFLEFEKRHKIEWIDLEKIVCSLKHKCSGQIDALAFVDGKLSLVDFKTSKRISEEMFLQTGAYVMCLSEMGINPEQRIILRLPKDIDQTFEACVVPTKLEEDIEAFLGLRKSWQYTNYIECKHSVDEEIVVDGRKYKNKKLIYQTL